MPKWLDRKNGRVKDYSCASGRRYTTGKRAYQCMSKPKCKVRWSKKRGRCKKTQKTARSGLDIRWKAQQFAFDDLPG
jgi:hypothetical protein